MGGAMDIVAVLQSAIESVGKLRELSKKVEEADFKMLVADLSCDLANAKLEAAHLKIELSNLTDENAELRNRLNTRETKMPSVSEGVYIFEGEDGHYCTACFDVHGRMVRLASTPSQFQHLVRWQCPACKANY